MTEKQIAASRANGAKSHGPKTEEGRQRSSQNAIKHGLYSSVVVLTNENQDRFLYLRDSYIQRFQPVDAIELEFVDQMVAATWRLHRVWAMEAEALEGGMDRVTPDLDNKFEEYPEETRICAAMQFIMKEHPDTLANLSRQESRLSRLHQRALNNLLKIRELLPPPVETGLRAVSPVSNVRSEKTSKNEPQPPGKPPGNSRQLRPHALGKSGTRPITAIDPQPSTSTAAEDLLNDQERLA